MVVADHFDVARVTWNDVDMRVANRLPRGLADIDANIEASRILALFEAILHQAKQPEDGDHFAFCQIEKVRDVASRDDERVSGRNGERIRERQRQVVRSLDTICRQIAEHAVSRS